MMRTSTHCSLKVLRIWSFIFVVVGCVQQRDATEGSPAAQTPQQPAAQAGPGPVREITNITGDLYRVKSRVVCKSERKLLDASVRLPWRPPSVREA